jgi:hypothetical protein
MTPTTCICGRPATGKRNGEGWCGMTLCFRRLDARRWRRMRQDGRLREQSEHYTPGDEVEVVIERRTAREPLRKVMAPFDYAVSLPTMRTDDCSCVDAMEM